jgi:hypothetical protein
VWCLGGIGPGHWPGTLPFVRLHSSCCLHCVHSSDVIPVEGAALGLHMRVCAELSDNICGVLVMQVLIECAIATGTTGYAALQVYLNSILALRVQVNVLSKQFNVGDWIHQKSLNKKLRQGKSPCTRDLVRVPNAISKGAVL